MAEPSLASSFDLPFAEQIDFFRQKTNLPTAKWDDIWQAAHDRAFVVAGAAKADLLDDLRQAVDLAITRGTTLETFRDSFRQIVFNRGWHGWTGEGSEAGFNWRTKVIYETNLRASYAAGREAQLADPGLQKLLPYRRYIHNDSVLHPRPLHLAWNGLTLPHDHEFWKTHSPPNGWGCRCRVTAVAAPKKGDATEPPAGWNKPGEDGSLPGIDKGWGYAPGESNIAELRRLAAEKARGLPPELQKPFLGDSTAAMDDSEAFSKGAAVGEARRESEKLLPAEPGGEPVKGALWKHPGTGQERIYFNNIADPGVKVFAVENSGLFEIRFQGTGLYGSQKDRIMNDLDRALEAWKGDRVTRWSDLKDMMTGGVKKAAAPIAPSPAPVAVTRPADVFTADRGRFDWEIKNAAGDVVGKYPASLSRKAAIEKHIETIAKTAEKSARSKESAAARRMVREKDAATLDALTAKFDENRTLIERAHMNADLSFTPMSAEDFSAKATVPVYQSRSFGGKKGSEYRLVMIDGDPAYARESDHWGKFSTNDFVNGEPVSNDHNWTLPGAETGWGNKKRSAGYILLKDLPK